MNHQIESEGAYLVTGTGTAHVIEWWDRSTDDARAVCGIEGTAEEHDPDRSDVCGNCARELGVEIEE